MSLKSVLEVVFTKKQAIADLKANEDQKTLASRQATIKRLETEVEGLDREYRKAVVGSVFPLFVVGGTSERQEAFKAATAEHDAISVDADVLFKRIAAKAKPYMGPSGKQMTPRAATFIIAELSDARAAFTPGAKLPNVPGNLMNGFLNDEESVLTAIRRTAATTGGPLLNALYSQTLVFEQIVAARVAADLMVVTVQNVRDTEVEGFKASFFPKRPSVVVNLDGEETIEELIAKAAGEARQIFGAPEAASVPAPEQENNLTSDDDEPSVTE